MTNRPTPKQLAAACHREFHYLVESYGFTPPPPVPRQRPETVETAETAPFEVRFQGPHLALLVQSIPDGYGTLVQFETLEGERLDVSWLLDRRAPGWSSRGSWKGPLKQIQGYATALRAHASDLLTGDLSGLGDLFADRAEFVRRSEAEARREQAEQRSYEWRDLRPRTLRDQADIARQVRTALGLLRVESRLLRSRLGDGHDASFRTRFAASWEAIEKRLEVERRQGASLTAGDARDWVDDGLRNLLRGVSQVRKAIASGELGGPVAECLEGLDRRSAELRQALDRLGRELEEVIERKGGGSLWEGS